MEPKLPTRDECFVLFDTYKVPPHIKEHILGVNRVGVFIAKQLKVAGIPISVELVDRATLLHDLFRGVDFGNLEQRPPYYPELSKETKEVILQTRKKYPGKKHAEVAYEFFKEDFPELAKTILVHNYRDVEQVLGEGSWEEKVTNYADKRFAQKIMTLKERGDDAIRRGYPEDKLKASLFVELEKQIFSHIHFHPDNLGKEMGEE